MFPIVPNVTAYRASACRCHAAASGVPGKEDLPMSAARIAFSTLAFPDASLATAISLGRSWGYAGVELRLIDRNLIDPAMTAADRMAVKNTAAAGGLPIVAVDSSIRLTDNEPDAELGRFIELASRCRPRSGQIWVGAYC